jgi:hypothetical protein
MTGVLPLIMGNGSAGVRIAVRLLPAGIVPRPELGKAVRVVRWAGGEPPVPGRR